MESQRERDFFFNVGRYGGERPRDCDSPAAWDAFQAGRELREIDRLNERLWQEHVDNLKKP